MKKTFKWATVILLLQLLLAACSKIDWIDVWHGGNKTQLCDVASFTLGYYSNQPNPFFFTKTYDPSGKYVKEIDAAFNNVRYPDDLIHCPLRVEYKPSKIYFVRMENPFDTVVTACLDYQGRVIRTNSHNWIFENVFKYRNNRLFSIQNNMWTDTCEYDTRGNILSMSHYVDYGEYGGIDRNGYFYTYDYSKKAKQQAYFEETRDINNDFTLMQYMGFFPELNPVNMRISSHNGLKNGYGFQLYMGNHVLDSKGKLVQYNLLTPPEENQQVITHALLTWQCK